MYSGNLNAVNHIAPPNSNLYDCAMQLNMIPHRHSESRGGGRKGRPHQGGADYQCSHDIKTPLTSIISYVELLKKEPDLPPHVVDYINTIISRKADRLNHYCPDVFEVSKAATGNISLNLEDLDIGKLLQQTFGEMEETLRHSTLTWRVDIPDAPMLVHADGQRLYRVFQNLIRNCDQYALEGSRARRVRRPQNGVATVSIRNISRSEITMDAEHLTARFVRGRSEPHHRGKRLGALHCQELYRGLRRQVPSAYRWGLVHRYSTVPIGAHRANDASGPGPRSPSPQQRPRGRLLPAPPQRRRNPPLPKEELAPLPGGISSFKPRLWVRLFLANGQPLCYNGPKAPSIGRKNTW